jgi:hypothetical protein
MNPDNPWRKIERAGSDLLSASLDYYRAMRDASTEATFFTIYANMFSLYLADRHRSREGAAQAAVESRDLPFVKEALASIQEGGYPEALARAGALLERKGEPLPLARLTTRKELFEAYADYLADLPLDQWRRIRGEQGIIASYEPEQALATLPALLSDKADRKRLLTLLDQLLADERVQSVHPTEEQLAMLERIRSVLTKSSAHERPVAALVRP